MTPPVDIAGLRALAEKATPGPWGLDGEPGGDLCTDDCEVGGFVDGRPVVLLRVNVRRGGMANAAFIAAARSAVPALCDRVEELERENAYLRACEEALIEAKRQRDEKSYEARRLSEENARLRAEVLEAKVDFATLAYVVNQIADGHDAMTVVTSTSDGQSLPEPVREALTLLAPVRRSDGEGGVG